MKTKNNRSPKKQDTIADSILIERIMDLNPEEPIPERIVKSFRRKFPNKSDLQLKAYLKGFRVGLGPNPCERAKDILQKS